MKTFNVYEGTKSHGTQVAESMKEAIRQTRMLLIASGVEIGDEGWFAVEVK